jgi:hypothetical protein
MKTKTLYAALSGAFLVGATTLVPAQQLNGAPAGSTLAHPIDNAKVAVSAEYRAEKEQIEADFMNAKAKCKDLGGNAKDVCHAEAKATQKVSMAQLEDKRQGTPHSAYEVQKTRAETAYDVAKEKCEDLAATEQSSCKKQAKADEKVAIATAKANMKKVASK